MTRSNRPKCHTQGLSDRLQQWGRHPSSTNNGTLSSDDGTVLVYDNAKAGRLGRRLPIAEATAAVITAQQHRARSRFPATPSAS